MLPGRVENFKKLYLEIVINLGKLMEIENKVFWNFSTGMAVHDLFSVSDKVPKIGRNRFFELANQQVVSSVLQNQFRLNFEDLLEKSSYSVSP